MQMEAKQRDIAIARRRVASRRMELESVPGEIDETLTVRFCERPRVSLAFILDPSSDASVKFQSVSAPLLTSMEIVEFARVSLIFPRTCALLRKRPVNVTKSSLSANTNITRRRTARKLELQCIYYTLE